MLPVVRVVVGNASRNTLVASHPWSEHGVFPWRTLWDSRHPRLATHQLSTLARESKESFQSLSLIVDLNDRSYCIGDIILGHLSKSIVYTVLVLFVLCDVQSKEINDSAVC